VDGGLKVPHRKNQFPGFTKKDGDVEERYNPDRCREYIFGGHVGQYMSRLEEEEPEKYKAHFKRFLMAGITADSLEEMYAEVHQKIRASPDRVAVNKKIPEPEVRHKYKNKAKQTLAQRKDHVLNKILSLKKKSAQ